MNDIYLNIIIIVVIIVLFLAYILIAYFYNNYTEYKSDVNDNLKKTKNYINNTTNTLTSNINISLNKTDTVKSELLNKIDNNLTNTSNLINNTNTRLNDVNSNVVNDSNNLNNFDNNFKYYFEFKDKDSIINNALFNHRFDVIPNLSLNILRNVTAISGMTVKTDADNLMKICDLNQINTSNCMNMNINNNSFNIYPTPTLNNNNNISNIDIYNKNKNKIIARFDLNSNNIYLGGSGEEAAALINNSDIYVKNIKLLDSTASYQNTTNNYPFDLDTIRTLYNTMNDVDNLIRKINGVYTIIKSTDPAIPNTLIINFKNVPNYGIMASKSISINVNELINTDNTNVNIINTDTKSSIFIPNVILNLNKITLTTIRDISPEESIRIKLTDPKIVISSDITENYITNSFSGTFN